MLNKHLIPPTMRWPSMTRKMTLLRDRIKGAGVVKKPLRLFNIRPVSVAWRGEGRAPAYRTLVCNAAYILRDGGAVDRRFGRMPRHFGERRIEMRVSGLVLPASAPAWAGDLYALWAAVDEAVDAAGDDTAVSGWHMVMTMPLSLSDWAWRLLAETFIHRHFTRRGAPALYAVHALRADDGAWLVAPHCHILVPSRRYSNSRRGRVGQRMVAWVGSRSQHDQLRAAWEGLVTPFIRRSSPDRHDLD